MRASLHVEAVAAHAAERMCEQLAQVLLALIERHNDDGAVLFDQQIHQRLDGVLLAHFGDLSDVLADRG